MVKYYYLLTRQKIRKVVSKHCFLECIINNTMYIHIKYYNMMLFVTLLYTVYSYYMLYYMLQYMIYYNHINKN